MSFILCMTIDSSSFLQKVGGEKVGFHSRPTIRPTIRPGEPFPPSVRTSSDSCSEHYAEDGILTKTLTESYGRILGNSDFHPLDPTAVDPAGNDFQLGTLQRLWCFRCCSLGNSLTSYVLFFRFEVRPRKMSRLKVDTGRARMQGLPEVDE